MQKKKRLKRARVNWVMAYGVWTENMEYKLEKYRYRPAGRPWSAGLLDCTRMVGFEGSLTIMCGKERPIWQGRRTLGLVSSAAG